jgi:hypothetical protein
MNGPEHDDLHQPTVCDDTKRWVLPGRVNDKPLSTMTRRHLELGTTGHAFELSSAMDIRPVFPIKSARLSLASPIRSPG